MFLETLTLNKNKFILLTKLIYIINICKKPLLYGYIYGGSKKVYLRTIIWLSAPTR